MEIVVLLLIGYTSFIIGWKLSSMFGTSGVERQVKIIFIKPWQFYLKLGVLLTFHIILVVYVLMT